MRVTVPSPFRRPVLCAAMLAALAGAAALAQDAGPAAAEAAAAAAPTEAAAASSSALIATGFVLLGVGAVLAFLELFVPTAGVLAVATAVCLVASVVAFFMHSVTWGFAALVAYSAGAPFAVVFGFKLWSRTPIARRMVLGDAREPDPDAPAGPPTRAAAGAVAAGDTGVALTALRPVGFARFGGERIEVVADLGMIEPGTEVVVTEASPSRVAVRARG